MRKALACSPALDTSIANPSSLIGSLITNRQSRIPYPVSRIGRYWLVHNVPIEPALDLHAFAPHDVSSVVEEYVRLAHEAGLREVRLIHGRGIGVQRGIVQNALERHPLVVEFYDAPESHLGATVAILRS